MVSIIADPKNPEKLILTATVSLYLDKVLLAALDEEIVKTIHDQAVKDISSNKAVKRVIAQAAQKKLLELLGVKAEQEQSNG